jgi:UDP-sugar transporter A1/2/3
VVAVFVCEICKLLISAVLFLVRVVDLWRQGTEIPLPSRSDTAWLALPGLFYTVTNIIVYEAIENIPLATFGVIRETRLVWNAIFWTIVFKIRLSRLRWVGIVGIVVGCIVSEVQVVQKAEFTWQIWWVFMLAFLNGLSGVVTEYAFKRKASVDINLQQMVLCAVCGCFSFLFLLVFRPYVVHSPSVFFKGFTPDCLQVILLQTVMGLVVGRMLKYIESVTKSILASLCSPLLTFIGSAALNLHLRICDIVASLIVISSCIIYLSEGSLAQPETDKSKKFKGFDRKKSDRDMIHYKQYSPEPLMRSAEPDTPRRLSWHGRQSNGGSVRRERSV